MEVEVTGEKFSIVRSRTKKITGSARLSATTIYYDRIAAIQLSKKGGWFTVSIKSGATGYLLNVYCRAERTAKRFIDALVTMQPHRASGEG